MKFSSDLNQFLGQLHQDFHLEIDAKAWFTDILVGLGRRRSKALASYLEKLLSQPYDLDDLEAQWTKSGAEFYLKDPKQIPVFLAMVRDLARSEQVTTSKLP